MSDPRSTKKNVLSPANNLTLFASIIAAAFLAIGMMIGNLIDSGPVIVHASPSPDVYTTPATATATTAPAMTNEASEVPLLERMEESILVSENSGIVNVGGEHHHHYASADDGGGGTPRVVEPTILEVPTIVERTIPATPKIDPVEIWTTPDIPADSRLGRTLLTLARFEQAGVRINVRE